MGVVGCAVTSAQVRLMSYDNLPLNIVILMEECGEVSRIASKCLRFGLDDFHPKNGTANRTALAEELGHIAAMTSLLVESGELSAEVIEQAATRKLDGLQHWYNWPGSMLGGARDAR